MKRRIISILCSVLIVFSMVGNLPAYAIYQEDYYVTVVRCNVRSTASTNGTILETVNAGTLERRCQGKQQTGEQNRRSSEVKLAMLAIVEVTGSDFYEE